MKITTDKEYLFTADLFRLLSKAFSYPDNETVDSVKTIAGQLMRQDQDNLELRSLLAKLYNEIDKTSIHSDYSRIFLTGGLPVSESYCTGRFDALGDVNGFYNAFGLNPKSGDVPDSIMYESEFLSLLALKIAVAPDSDKREITERAFNKFLNDHYNEFLKKFSEKLSAVNPIKYYQLLIKIAEEASMLTLQI